MNDDLKHIGTFLSTMYKIITKPYMFNVDDTFIKQLVCSNLIFFIMLFLIYLISNEFFCIVGLIIIIGFNIFVWLNFLNYHFYNGLMVFIFNRNQIRHESVVKRRKRKKIYYDTTTFSSNVNYIVNPRILSIEKLYDCSNSYIKQLYMGYNCYYSHKKGEPLFKPI